MTLVVKRGLNGGQRPVFAQFCFALIDIAKKPKNGSLSPVQSPLFNILFLFSFEMQNVIITTVELTQKSVKRKEVKK